MPLSSSFLVVDVTVAGAAAIAAPPHPACASWNLPEEDTIDCLVRATRWVLECGPVLAVTELQAADVIWDDSAEALRETQLQELVTEDGEILLRLRLAGQSDVEEVLQFTPVSLAESSMRPLQEKALGSGRATAVHGANSVFSWATEDEGDGESNTHSSPADKLSRWKSLEFTAIIVYRLICAAESVATVTVSRSDTDCRRPLFRTELAARRVYFEYRETHINVSYYMALGVEKYATDAKPET